MFKYIEAFAYLKKKVGQIYWCFVQNRLMDKLIMEELGFGSKLKKCDDLAIK